MFKETVLPGVIEFTPKRFQDNRGYFTETYNFELFKQQGIETVFVQDNQSLSVEKGVLRGLHYQLAPRAQVKLVRVVSGRILDVAVDIRRESPTFKQWVGVELSAELGNQLYIPAGFAHGFLTLEPNSVIAYKVSDFYAPEQDRGLHFLDAELAIDWPVDASEMIISDKDLKAPSLNSADLF